MSDKRIAGPLLSGSLGKEPGMKIVCQECGKTVWAAERHTYEDCMKVKRLSR